MWLSDSFLLKEILLKNQIKLKTREYKEDWNHVFNMLHVLKVAVITKIVYKSCSFAQVKVNS